MVNEIDLVNKLKQVGVQPKQAEAHVKTMTQYASENLATKKDIEKIHYRFDQIDNKFVSIENKFVAIDNRFDALENKVEALGGKILLKLFWLNVGFFTIAGVLATLIFKH